MRTASHDHLLVGSANCTVAALGNGTFDGSNSEACLYRRLPRGGAGTLGLEDLFFLEPIDVAEITRVASEPIPLNTLADLSPGAFDLNGTALEWTLGSPRWAAATIQLLDHSLDVVEEIAAERFMVVGSRRVAPVANDTCGRALFARGVLPQASSALAHLSRRAALRANRREPTTGAVARALAQVATGDLDFLLQQAFEELHREDVKSGDPATLRAVRPATASGATEERPHRILTYEEFMRSRPPGASGRTEGGNTLAGAHCDTVRDLLNRLTGQRRRPRQDVPVPSDGDDEDSDDTLPNLPDEEALEGEALAGQSQDDGGEAKVVKVDAVLFQKRIRTYCDKLHTEAGPLGPGDVLCFRLWILIVLYHARCPDLPKGLTSTIDETGWPRMLVRLLSAFFCKPKPALARLIIGMEERGLPEDFAECWATALWAVHALSVALPRKGATAALSKIVPVLRQQMLTVLLLGPAELSSSEMTDRFQGLDATLGLRLRLPPLAEGFRAGDNTTP